MSVEGRERLKTSVRPRNNTNVSSPPTSPPGTLTRQTSSNANSANNNNNNNVQRSLSPQQARPLSPQQIRPNPQTQQQQQTQRPLSPTQTRITQSPSPPKAIYPPPAYPPPAQSYSTQNYSQIPHQIVQTQTQTQPASQQQLYPPPNTPPPAQIQKQYHQLPQFHEETNVQYQELQQDNETNETLANFEIPRPSGGAKKPAETEYVSITDSHFTNNNIDPNSTQTNMNDSSQPQTQQQQVEYLPPDEFDKKPTSEEQLPQLTQQQLAQQLGALENSLDEISSSNSNNNMSPVENRLNEIVKSNSQTGGLSVNQNENDNSNNNETQTPIRKTTWTIKKPTPSKSNAQQKRMLGTSQNASSTNYVPSENDLQLLLDAVNIVMHDIESTLSLFELKCIKSKPTNSIQLEELLLFVRVLKEIRQVSE